MKQRLLEALRPGRSYWALVGIVLFFFVPEIVAFIWGDEIQNYFIHLAANEPNMQLAKIYKLFEDFGEVSFLNLFLGGVFTVWFFVERSRGA